MVKRKKSEIFLGFVGLPCAGKGTAIDYLVKHHDFFYSSTSDEIREEIRRRGQEISRENLQKTAGEMRQKHGSAIWVEKAWKKVAGSGKMQAVIDGLRATAEIDFLKKQSGFKLIAVLAKPGIRFQRMTARNREGDPKTYQDFKKMEKRDKKDDGRDIDACLAMADFEVENNRAIKDLEKKVEEILSRFK